MNEKIIKFWRAWGNVIVIVVGVLYFFLLASLKNGFYVDEIFSFGHANSTVGAFMSPSIDAHFIDENKELHAKWIDNEVFRKYLMVQEGEAGNFKNIYKNLSKDVHPPFYFVLLHLSSSLFEGKLEAWAGLGLNLICLILMGVMFNRLAFLCLKDKAKANILTGLFIFLPSVIELMVFIRMYSLFLLFNIWLCLEAVKIIDDKELKVKNLIGAGIALMCSCLTHFYGLIYGFFISTGVMGVMCWDRRFRDAFKFGGVMLFGVLGTWAIFPYMVEVLLFSDRGEESLMAVRAFDPALLFFRLDYFLKQFFRASFGAKREWHWGVMFGVFCLLMVVVRERGKREIFDKKLAFLLWCAVMGCVVISIVAPDMRKFSGRYYVVAVLYFILWLFMVGDKFFSVNRIRQFWGVLGILLFMGVNMVEGAYNPYLQRDSEIQKLNEYVKDKRVVSVVSYKEVVFNYNMLDSFLLTQSVYKLSADDFVEVEQFLKSNELNKGDVVILQAGMGKNVGNKKTLEKEEYRLKYKDLLFVGMFSFEIYERY